MLKVPESGKHVFMCQLSLCFFWFVFFQCWIIFHLIAKHLIYIIREDESREEVRRSKLTGRIRVRDIVVENPVNQLEIHPKLWPQ